MLFGLLFCTQIIRCFGFRPGFLHVNMRPSCLSRVQNVSPSEARTIFPCKTQFVRVFLLCVFVCFLGVHCWGLSCIFVGFLLSLLCFFVFVCGLSWIFVCFLLICFHFFFCLLFFVSGCLFWGLL